MSYFSTKNLVMFEDLSPEDRIAIKEDMIAVKISPHHLGNDVIQYSFRSPSLTACCPFENDCWDFYTIEFQYVPSNTILENFSVDRYLANWRNVRIGAEDLLNAIFTDFVAVLEPQVALVRMFEGSSMNFCIHQLEREWNPIGFKFRPMSTERL